MSVVLVIDDEPDIRLLAKAVLTSAGHSVHEADSGVAGLETLDLHDEIDVVLLDLRMPDMDGLEVLGEMRARGHLDRVRVVAFSAHVDPETQRVARHAGADRFLTKPFVFDQLVAAVEVDRVS